MTRPVKCRRVCRMPKCGIFTFNSEEEARKSCTGGNSEEPVFLAVDEYETIRLIDYLGYAQADCAVQMNVARTTVQSIYDSARKKIADAVVNGRSLAVSGGNFELCSDYETCRGMPCGRLCGRHNETVSDEDCCSGCRKRCCRRYKEINEKKD